jgi:hypothetical protein
MGAGSAQNLCPEPHNDLRGWRLRCARLGQTGDFGQISCNQLRFKRMDLKDSTTSKVVAKRDTASPT